MMRGYELLLPGWCLLYEPQVGVSTTCGEISTRGTTVFRPQFVGVVDVEEIMIRG